MGKRRQVTSALVSILLTALVWELGDAIPRMTFWGKVVVCGFIFVASLVIGSILSGGK